MADAAAERVRRIVVLISGSGTNLQALIDAQNTPALPHAHIVLVLSNRKAAYGLTRAQNANPPIPTRYLALQPYLKAKPEKEDGEQQRPRTRDTYDAEVARIVLDARPDIVVLAGWMHVFGEGFLDAMAVGIGSGSGGGGGGGGGGDGSSLSETESTTPIPVPVINLHPALPGAFEGAGAIERGYEAFQKGEVDRVGAMIHRVVKEVDRGEPVVVREVEIRKGEPLAAFEERLHRTEWEIIVEGTQTVLGQVRPT